MAQTAELNAEMERAGAWVFVAGRALKENGKVTGVNERKLVEAAQAATDHIAPFLDP